MGAVVARSTANSSVSYRTCWTHIPVSVVYRSARCGIKTSNMVRSSPHLATAIECREYTVEACGVQQVGFEGISIINFAGDPKHHRLYHPLLHICSGHPGSNRRI